MWADLGDGAWNSERTLEEEGLELLVGPVVSSHGRNGRPFPSADGWRSGRLNEKRAAEKMDASFSGSEWLVLSSS